MSVRDIAREAGIKESSVYNHFSSKEDILESLYRKFIEYVPQTRPSDEALEAMHTVMQPEEIFKNILFHAGQNAGGTLANTAMVINQENLKSQRAADMDYRYVVQEPAA